jgi:hypothetical protein
VVVNGNDDAGIERSEALSDVSARVRHAAQPCSRR